VVKFGNDFCQRVPKKNKIDDHTVSIWSSGDQTGNSPIVTMRRFADVVSESDKVAS
jgi:hypothetical protein